MAQPTPMIGPSFTINNTVNGQMLKLGDTAPGGNDGGGFSVDFVPSVDWAGTIEFKGRNSNMDASSANAPFVGPWPFRAFVLNGTASDGSMVSGNAALVTSFSSIIIPSSGKAIAMMVACTAGSCQVFIQPTAGCTAP